MAASIFSVATIILAGFPLTAKGYCPSGFWQFETSDELAYLCRNLSFRLIVGLFLAAAVIQLVIQLTCIIINLRARKKVAPYFADAAQPRQAKRSEGESAEAASGSTSARREVWA
jgi:hypothetical protein